MSIISKSELNFDPPLTDFGEERRLRSLTVFSGANNSGKSLVLKWLKYNLGLGSYLIGTNRFYHVYHLSSGSRDPNQAQNFEVNFQNNFNQDHSNHEQNIYDLNAIITGLGDTKRNTLFELCGKLIGNTFTMLKVDSENDLSNRYIDMDGQNLSVASTGTRLLMTMLGICMDDQFDTILIDEPELGLGPRIQMALSDFFNNPGSREQYFPHLKRIYLATHSQLFLSRNEISDNFVVKKSGKNIAIKQINSISDFHRLQFNLLGNTLEHMFFPSAIIVVEGKTDHAFLERIIQNRFSGKRITIIQSGGDVKKKIAGLKEAFDGLETSPFRTRLFVVLDSVHQRGLEEELVKMGMVKENIIIWRRNGIEYVYPIEIIAKIFMCGEDRISEMVICDDRVELNGMTKTKNNLKDDVLSYLTATTVLPAELEDKLLKPILKSIS